MGTKSHKTWAMDELKRLVERCSNLGYDDILITETTSYRAWGAWSKSLNYQFDRTLDGASWRTRYLIAKRKIREAEQLKTAEELDAKPKTYPAVDRATDSLKRLGAAVAGAGMCKAGCPDLDAVAAKHQQPALPELELQPVPTAPTAPDKALIDALEDAGHTSLIIALYRGQTLEQYARKLAGL